jgi:hypothetical protein
VPVLIEQRGDHEFVDPLGLERHAELVVQVTAPLR